MAEYLKTILQVSTVCLFPGALIALIFFGPEYIMAGMAYNFYTVWAILVVMGLVMNIKKTLNAWKRHNERFK